jgi:hypothetical protein
VRKLISSRRDTNQPPGELHENVLFEQMDDDRRKDFGSRLREFAMQADKSPDRCRWSFHRDFGDVLHVYLAAVEFFDAVPSGVVYQAVFTFPQPAWCKRSTHQARRMVRDGRHKLARSLAWMVGVNWHLYHPEPWFDNQVATSELPGRQALLRFEKRWFCRIERFYPNRSLISLKKNYQELHNATESSLTGVFLLSVQIISIVCNATPHKLRTRSALAVFYALHLLI